MPNELFTPDKHLELDLSSAISLRQVEALESIAFSLSRLCKSVEGDRLKVFVEDVVFSVTYKH